MTSPSKTEEKHEDQGHNGRGRTKSNSEKKRRRAIRELQDVHDRIEDGHSPADIRELLTVRIAELEKENRDYLKTKEEADGKDGAKEQPDGEESAEEPAGKKAGSKKAG